MSGTVLGGIEIQMLADLARLRQDMNDAKGIVGEGAKAIQGLADGLKAALGGIAGAMTVGAVIAWARGLTDAAGSLNDLAIQTGASVESLSALVDVGKTTGTTAETIAGAMNKLAKALATADDEGDAARVALKALGLDFKSFTALKPDQQMIELANAFAKFNDGGGKSAVAMALIRGEGAKLLPFFADLAKAGKLNATLTTEQAAAADDFGDKIAQMRAELDKAGTSMLVGMLPAMTKMLSAIGPLLAITAAYFALLKGAPLLLAAYTTLKTAATAALVKFQLSAAISGSTLLALKDAMLVASAGTLTLTTAVTKLQMAVGVMFAAFAGWEIGTWLRENFVEAQLAGVAFVSGTLKGWEAIKYGAQVAWAYIGSAWRETVEAMGGVMATFMEGLANGLSALGLDAAAAKLSSWAGQVRTSTESSAGLDDELRALEKTYAANTEQIDQITSGMADEAIAHFNAGKGAKEHGQQLNYSAEEAKRAKEAKAALAAEIKRQAAEQEKLTKAGQDYLEKLNAEYGAVMQSISLGRELTETEKALAKLEADLAAGKIKLTDAERLSAEMKLREIGATAEQRKQGEEHQKLLISVAQHSSKLNDEQIKVTESLREGNVGLIEQNEKLRIGEAAWEARQVAVLLSAATEKEMSAATSENSFQLLEQARLLRDRATLLQDGVVLREAKAAATEWAKTTDQIGQGLTDSLFRAFESGAGFFSTLWSGIKNLFKTTVLQLAIKPVQGAITGAVGSLLGMPASASTGGGGGLGSLLGSLGGLGNFGGGIGAGFSALFGEAGLTGALDAAGIALGAGNLAGGLGTLMGSLGPIAAAIGVLGPALHKVFKGGAGTPHMGSVVGVTGTSSSTLYGDPSQILNNYNSGTDEALRATGGVAVSALNRLAAAFGGAQNFSAVLKFAADGRDPSIGDLALSRGDTSLTNWGATQGDYKKYAADGQAGFEAYVKDVAAATRDAMSAVGLPQWAKDTFGKLASNATLADIAGTAEAVAQTQRALQALQLGVSPLGGVFARVAGLSSDALFELTKFAGGIDAFSAKLKGYVGAFYSQDEQAAISAQSVQKLLQDTGISTTGLSSKADFRGLVDSTDVSTEAGRRQLAALLEAAQGFAAISDVLAASGGSLADLAGRAPGGALLGNLLTDQGNAGGTAATSASLLTAANGYLTSIADSSQAALEHLAALVGVQSQGTQALLAALARIGVNLEDALRPGYLGDLAADSNGG